MYKEDVKWRWLLQRQVTSLLVCSHHVISDIMIAEVHLEAGGVLGKAFWTSDPTFSFQTALTS